MAEILPFTLARSRRGLCPTCGAALALKGSGRTVRCGFCGGESMVERRLRKIDAETELLDPAGGRGEDSQWLAEALGEIRVEKVSCPGCGDEFEGNMAHEILTCGSCGTQSKVERRMVRPEARERLPPQRRSRADFERQSGGNPGLKWDVQTEQLFWRITNETDPKRRVAYALKFEDWSFINATAVYFLPHLLPLARKDDIRIAKPVCGCVGKLLCQEDAGLWAPALEACEPFVLDPCCSTELLHEIGLGSSRGMKLLLDAADAAARAGAVEYATNALWAAHYIIERNFDDHPTIGEIMLYRLFYLSPLPMGWVLKVISSGEGGYVFKNPYPYLEFLDDCVYERPELVSFLATRPHAPDVETAGEMLERARFIGGLSSKPAKSAALNALANIAEGSPEEVIEAALAFFEPWLDDPELAGAATVQLRRYIKDGDGSAGPLVGLIRRRGHSLPEIVQREVHWKLPKNDLLDRSKIPPFYDGEPETVFSPTVTRAIETYESAINKAVDARYAELEKARRFWQSAHATRAELFSEDE